MKKILLKGSDRERVGMPSVKHELFFKFLLISPSYYLAHEIVKKKKVISSKKLPNDFSKVLDTYKKVGDIYEISFDAWWDKRGKKILLAEKKSLFFPIKINLGKTKEQVLLDVKKLLDRFDNETLLADPNKKISFLKNKTRLKTLEERYELAYIKARWSPEINTKSDGSLGKKLPNWFVALEAYKFLESYKKSIHIKKIMWEDKKTKNNESCRNYLGMLVNKHLKEALSFSENAARGIFPSNKSSNNHLTFNYKNIFDIRLRQLHFHFTNLLMKNGQGKKGYTQQRVLKKEKIIEKLDKLNDLIESKALVRAREIINRQDSFI